MRERGWRAERLGPSPLAFSFFYCQTLNREWALFLKKRIRQPRQKRLPIALTHAQVLDLLGRVTNPIHKACFMVMYACGLRIGEAVTLQVTAIDKTNMVLRVIGKGNTERRISAAATDV